jgi:hypothetical protein
MAPNGGIVLLLQLSVKAADTKLWLCVMMVLSRWRLCSCLVVRCDMSLAHKESGCCC